MVFRQIPVKERQKDVLDELKRRKRKESGEDPSYSDILDEVFEETGIVEDKKKRKKKKEKGGRDFMELF